MVDFFPMKNGPAEDGPGPTFHTSRSECSQWCEGAGVGRTGSHDPNVRWFSCWTCWFTIVMSVMYWYSQENQEFGKPRNYTQSSAKIVVSFSIMLSYGIYMMYFYVYAYPPLGDRGGLVIQMFRCPCEESAVASEFFCLEFMPGIVKWQWWCLVSGINSTTFGMWTTESDHHSFCLPNCLHHNVCCFHFHYAKCL
jgi:hypothetical protein